MEGIDADEITVEMTLEFPDGQPAETITVRVVQGETTRRHNTSTSSTQIVHETPVELFDADTGEGLLTYAVSRTRRGVNIGYYRYSDTVDRRMTKTVRLDPIDERILSGDTETGSGTDFASVRSPELYELLSELLEAERARFVEHQEIPSVSEAELARDETVPAAELRVERGAIPRPIAQPGHWTTIEGLVARPVDPGETGPEWSRWLDALDRASRSYEVITDGVLEAPPGYVSGQRCTFREFVDDWYSLDPGLLIDEFALRETPPAELAVGDIVVVTADGADTHWVVTDVMPALDRARIETDRTEGYLDGSEGSLRCGKPGSFTDVTALELLDPADDRVPDALAARRTEVLDTREAKRAAERRYEQTVEETWSETEGGEPINYARVRLRDTESDTTARFELRNATAGGWEVDPTDDRAETWLRTRDGVAGYLKDNSPVQTWLGI